ncbi:MAG: LPS-assembly protein LptD, partial [Hyphomicrobiaceae bacterium]
SDRNHFRMQSYQFGGLLFTDSDVAESRVHPIIDWNYIVGMPVLGGELGWNLNALSFSRDQSFTDYKYDTIDKTTKTQRIVADINWRRKFTDGIGISYTPFANLRGDALTFDNAVDPLKNHLIDESTVTRGIATAGVLASYPWLANGSRGSHIIEPIGQIIARTAKVDQRDLPNEDARSIVFDDTNLFEFNKTSGLDRVETGTRANVGVQYTFQAYTGGHARILAGQSFHLSGDNIYNGYTGVEPSIDPKTASSILAPNNGLQNNSSDYVLGAYVAPSDIFTFIGQGRFDHNDLQLQRADVAADFRYGPLNAQAIYTFAAFDPVGGRYDLAEEQCNDTDCLTELSDAYKARLANELLDQQDLIGTVSLQLSERWRIIGATRFDIDKREGRQNSVSVRYADDCFVLTTTYTQSNIEDPNRDITRDQTILLRFELKHIGEFSYRSDALDHLFGENQVNF